MLFHHQVVRFIKLSLFKKLGEEKNYPQKDVKMRRERTHAVEVTSLECFIIF